MIFFLPHQSLMCLPVTRACMALPRAAPPAGPHPQWAHQLVLCTPTWCPSQVSGSPCLATVKASLGGPLGSTSWVHGWAPRTTQSPLQGWPQLLQLYPWAVGHTRDELGLGRVLSPSPICPQACTSTDGPCSLGSWAPPCSLGICDGGADTGPATSAGHLITLYLHPGRLGDTKRIQLVFLGRGP